MATPEKALRVVEVLRDGLSELLDELKTPSPIASLTTPLIALGQWRNDAIHELQFEISYREARNLEKCELKIPLHSFNFVERQAEKYDRFLARLATAIEKRPYSVLEEDLPIITTEENIDSFLSSRDVFIVHGHDQKNLRILEGLLKDKFQLNPIILSSQPSGGQTIIEKFESEAKKAAFAFALFTPDDVIQNSSKEYSQARPNVIFELGWFYGRLGRKRTCILVKEGTEIQSDLLGIEYVEFSNCVDEREEKIKQELITGGLLSE